MAPSTFRTAVVPAATLLLALVFMGQYVLLEVRQAKRDLAGKLDVQINTHLQAINRLELELKNTRDFQDRAVRHIERQDVRSAGTLPLPPPAPQPQLTTVNVVQTPCPNRTGAREQQLYRMQVFVFTYNRVTGLQRIVKSLVESDYLGHKVDLTLFIDNQKKTPDKTDSPDFGTSQSTDTPIMLWVRNELAWPHGDLRVHRREKNAGLKRSIMEAWYPMTDDTMGAFFEDDTEVSPLWYKWVDAALRQYYFVPNRSPRLIGLSLYRYIHDELNSRALRVDNGHRPFIFQSPCSWGAVYFPGPWRQFRDWFPTVATDPKLPWSTPSNDWFWWDSWKKFLIKLMWENGLHMVYVHLPDDMVLSTNHLMKGMHNLPPREKFELPLLTREHYAEALAAGTDLLQCPPLPQLKVLDMKLKAHALVTDLPGATSNYRLTL